MIEKKEVVVSILMTSFNRELYIAEAIESIINSNFLNFELIIVDDCSNDKTVAIAKKYAANDKRIFIYENEKNIGQFANRNKAASYAKGKYLKYVDSDDTIASNCIEVMVEAMVTYPQADLGFCYTMNSLIDRYPFLIDSKTAYKEHFFAGGLLTTGPSGLIFKKTAFEEVRGFEEFGMPSDNHLSLKLAGRNAVVALEPALFIWRQHTDQIFAINRNNYNNILNNYQFNKDIILKYSPLTKAENEKILYNQKKIFFKNLFKLCFKKGKPFLALHLLLQMNSHPIS